MTAVIALIVAVAAFLLAAVTLALVLWLSRTVDDDPWQCECDDD